MSDNKYYFTSNVLAYTLDEIILHGMRHCSGLVNGMPWSFKFCGHNVTHEDDDVYIVDNTRMTHGDVLVVNIPYTDVITILPMSAFVKTYIESDE